MAGGGLRAGQVGGASDARGEQVKSQAITPQMMLVTVYHTPDHAGRPMYLLDEREKIEQLI